MEPILVKHNEYIEQVERWLIKEEAMLYDEWLNSIKMNPADESIDEMDNARHLMFSQLIDTINGKLSETAIREMAKKLPLNG